MGTEYPMSIKEKTIKQQYWHCDECDYEWLRTEIYPERCPSKQCRSRKWDKHRQAAPKTSTSEETLPETKLEPKLLIEAPKATRSVSVESPCGIPGHVGVDGKGPNKDLWYCLNCDETFQQY